MVYSKRVTGEDVIRTQLQRQSEVVFESALKAITLPRAKEWRNNFQNYLRYVALGQRTQPVPRHGLEDATRGINALMPHS